MKTRQYERTAPAARYLALGLLSLPLLSMGGCSSAPETDGFDGFDTCYPGEPCYPVGGTPGVGGAASITGGAAAVGGAVTGGSLGTGATGVGGLVGTGGTGTGAVGTGAVGGTGAVSTGGDVGTGGDVATGGTSDTGGTAGTGADTGTGAGTSTGGAATGGTSTGGTSTGGTSSGGTGGVSTGGTSSGGTGGTSSCTNVAPPYDPNWPEATCDKWANETAECGQAWFADYCDESCGRCTAGTGGTSGTGGVSSGGTSGTGGVSSGGSGTGGVSTGGVSSGGTGGVSTGGTSSGGTSSGGTGGTSSCTNVSPPYDPNWPDATCDKWANETAECGQAWFADYCDLSCGRCSGTGGSSGTGGTSSGGAGGTSSGGGGTSSGGSGGGTTLPNITNGQNGWASRYWDCCKPHCAWPGNGGTEAVCAANGTSQMSSETQSACSGGNGYVCNSDAPRAISSTVSYGYAAVPNPQCGACYHIQFTGTSHNAGNDPGSAALNGKHMIVRVSNTGGDVASGQFDLMIPGGGVGVNPNTCPTQWGASSGNMGSQYGGFLSSCTGDHAARKTCVRNKCNTVVPAGQLRDSCNWFVDWFEVADNPNFKVEPIACPSDI